MEGAKVKKIDFFLSVSGLKAIAISFLILLFCSFSAASTINLFKENIEKLDDWLYLLQYRKSSDGYQSKITKPDFFMIGRNDDPSSEFEREIELFSKQLPVSEMHPQCRFPARYRLLKRIFPLVEPVDCRPLIAWKDAYGLSHISVMYAAQYLSNPASVFGHTFVLLGSDKLEEQRQFTFNFAANIPEKTGAIDYIFKGLTGGFEGVFSTLPFYHRLHVYTNMENRSLWEYQLNLTSEENDLFLDYLWEMINLGKLEYRFLNENCASVLLWFLKAVRPQIEISTSNPLIISPPDIVGVLKREGLVEKVKFHPSQTERLLSKVFKMHPDEKKRFVSIIDTQKLPDTEMSSLVLDAAIDHLAIQRHRNNGELPAALQQLNHDSLLARSRAPEIGESSYSNEMVPQSPDLSHPPLRISAGIVRLNDLLATSLRFRPAIHGILDREAGYLKNSSLEFFEIEVLLPQLDKAVLSQVNFVNFQNVQPINIYESPLSWQFSLRWSDLLQSGSTLKSGFQGDATIGFAKEFDSRVTAYGMLGADLRTPEFVEIPRYGLGPKFGLLLSIGGVKSEFEYSYFYPAGQSEAEEKSYNKLKAGIRIEMALRHSLVFEYEMLKPKLFSESRRTAMRYNYFF